MRKLVKFLVSRLYAPVLLHYLAQDRVYTFNGIELLIKKGVFHPAFFFSTRFLWSELKKHPLRDKTLLELGAGSGLIAFSAARAGAIVTASDISSIAISGLQENAQRLTLPVTIIQSDLFAAIPQQHFDYIIINPPYYPRNPENEAEMAWFCGPHFEYFQHLFAQVGNYMQRNTTVFMSLSEDCDRNKIKAIAAANRLNLILGKEKRIAWEQNYIYQVHKQ